MGLIRNNLFVVHRVAPAGDGAKMLGSSSLRLRQHRVCSVESFVVTNMARWRGTTALQWAFSTAAAADRTMPNACHTATPRRDAGRPRARRNRSVFPQAAPDRVDHAESNRVRGEPSWPTTMSSARKLPTRTCAGVPWFRDDGLRGFSWPPMTCKAGELEAVGTRLRDVFSYLDGSGITVAVASQYLPRYGLFEKSLHLQTLLGLRSRVSGKSH